jgi:membrane-associated phospholipid phosphatase
MRTRKNLARWTSIVGHPFVSILLLVAIASWATGGHERALHMTGIVAGAVLLPLGFFIWRRYSSGQWQTVDASAPSDRPALYAVAFVLLLPVGFYFLAIRHAAEMTRGFVAVAALIGLAATFNRWIKLSVHMIFATFAALIILQLTPVLGVALFLFLPLLGWSRLILSRHSVSEVIGGFVIGFVVGAAALWL